MRFGPILAVWCSWLVLMSGANLATPLYVVYARQFHFSSLVLTSVFATYAVVLVPALILFGRLSDRFGRRPVMLAGLGVACAALLVFLFAQNAVWLYAARALQGLAVGTISGAATAALVELDPDDDRQRAAMFAGLAQAGGSALGPLVGGALAQWAPYPLRLVYIVGLVVTMLAAVATMRIPDTREGEPEPWRIQRPRIPREERAAFFRVGLTGAAVWAAVALYLSIVPSYAGALLHTHDLALLAAVSAVALATSFVGQIVTPRGNQAIGLLLLAIGLVGLVAAAPLHSLALLLAGGVATGAGHAVAFLGAQHELNDLAPAERRGEVTAAFIGCIYLGVAATVIAAGLLATQWSLSFSVGVVASTLAVAAGSAAVWQFTVTRPHRSR